MSRHYLGRVGKVANGITTMRLAYARERTGHALFAISGYQVQNGCRFGLASYCS